MVEVDAGEAGQVEVQLMGNRATGEVGSGGESVTDLAKACDTCVDVDVLRLDDGAELRSVRDEQRLDETVLVVVVQIQQVDEIGAAREQIVDLLGVTDVGTAGVHCRVEQRVADALVDLAVEVVGETGFEILGRGAAGTVIEGCSARTPGDLALMDRHIDAFRAAAPTIGISDAAATGIFPADVVALELEFDEVYDQTPGVGAGRKIG